MTDGEIIARVERRWKWTAQEKAALLAEVEVEGGKVAVVARRHGISDSLLYNWRSAWNTQSSSSSHRRLHRMIQAAGSKLFLSADARIFGKERSSVWLSAAATCLARTTRLSAYQGLLDLPKAFTPKRMTRRERRRTPCIGGDATRSTVLRFGRPISSLSPRRCQPARAKFRAHHFNPERRRAVPPCPSESGPEHENLKRSIDIPHRLLSREYAAKFARARGVEVADGCVVGGLRRGCDPPTIQVMMSAVQAPE